MNVVPVVKGYFYKYFMSNQLRNFKSTKGAVGLARWFERTESVFLINTCAEYYKDKYATRILLEDALSWWNVVAKPISI